MVKVASKNGLTLVELLGAIVLLGITITLVSTVLIQIQTASKSIYSVSNLNRQATLITREIENTLRDMPVDHAQICTPDGKCLLVEKWYEYIINVSEDTIDLVVSDPPISKTITFEQGEIRIDGVNILPGSISLKEESVIDIIRWTKQETIRFSITIVDESGTEYSFNIIHTYPITP
ncbi:MAG: hypothetical protein WCY62_01970 [Clostridia bacterium]|jgi:hypothetical protein